MKTVVLNDEFVGNPDIKVILKKRSQQYVMPPNKTFDIDFTTFSGGFQNTNVRLDNLYFHQQLGCLMIQPLFINRSNYVFGDPVLTKSLSDLVEVPKGALSGDGVRNQESQNEIDKRVWVAKPTFYQKPINATQPMDNFEDPSEGTFGAYTGDYNGPKWISKPDTNSNTRSGGGTGAPVFWSYQTNTNPNIEWFIHQKY
ncbi:MAG: hypothetical protein Q7R33_07690, partial [Nitrosarchaeum sp.]|nr:hypothetical protein [Nitrosarchaeum sp.]